MTGGIDDGGGAIPLDANDQLDQLASLNFAIEELAKFNPQLASALTRVTYAIAAEVVHNKPLAAALSEALNPQNLPGPGSARNGPSRRPRRSAGPWDPFTVYTEQGEQALRDRLAALDLEQLRDIIAEHGMDTDRLAMKWRDPNRVVSRIVERVIDRAAKGDAFRSAPRQ